MDGKPKEQVMNEVEGGEEGSQENRDQRARRIECDVAVDENAQNRSDRERETFGQCAGVFGQVSG